MLPFSFLSLGIRALPYLAVTAVSIYLTSQWMGWKNEGKLNDLREQLNVQCKAAAAEMERANDELQKANTDIAGRLSRYKRLHPNTCVKLSESAQPAPGWRGYVGTDELLDFAAECETYRSQRIILEGLLK